MSFRQLAEARFSLRHYDSRPVEEEKINYLLECVRLAPSAVDRKSTRLNSSHL